MGDSFVWGVGAVRLLKGQRYECTAIEPFRRKDGAMSGVAVVVSHCATCGAAFSQLMRIKQAKFEPNRRCAVHKRPGQRVKTPAGSIFD